MPISDCYPDMWIDPDEFASAKQVDDVDSLALAIEEASWILHTLTGYRYSSKYQGRRDIYRLRDEVRVFRLSHGPVAKVFGVKVIDLRTNTSTPWDDWVYLRGGDLRIRDGCGTSGCNTKDQVLEVDYLTKPNLPPGALRAVGKLAYELFMSSQGAPCALPDRVTSVSRQGVSWTMLDPMDFLDKGLTGLGSVDQWISSAINRGLASATDPLRWLELVESEVIGCGEDFEP